MKKILAFLCMVSLCFAIAACDPAPSQLNYNDLAKDVVSIELIEYDNPDQKAFSSWVPDHSSKLLPFASSNAMVLEALDESAFEDFLMQLSEEEILSEYCAYNSPKGKCLKVSYESGDFLIISCNQNPPSFNGYIGYYSADGQVLDFIGSFSSYSSFQFLVNYHFEFKI